MATEQINVPSLVLILFLTGLIIRYLFFSSPPDPARRRRQQHLSAQQEAALRSRLAAAERVHQMFPQVDRRTIMWDLQRNGGNMAATTERILAGRMEVPPRTFQPPIPPSPTVEAAAAKQAPAAAKPDLITLYNLKDKVAAAGAQAGAGEGGAGGSGSGSGAGGGVKGWSANKDERHSLLQRRRDQMILDARRKMEAKMAAERAVEKGAAGQR